jgi:hypothetical protein
VHVDNDFATQVLGCFFSRLVHHLLKFIPAVKAKKCRIVWFLEALDTSVGIEFRFLASTFILYSSLYTNAIYRRMHSFKTKFHLIDK